MADLFKEIIPAILTRKTDPFLGNYDSYAPFLVNKALSFHYDCILQANQMNMNHSLDKDMQFQFLLNSVRAWKRPFQKWQKLVKDEDIDLVKEYYGFSNDKAKAALKVLDEDQLQIIREEMDKGGANGKPKRSNRGET